MIKDYSLSPIRAVLIPAFLALLTACDGGSNDGNGSPDAGDSGQPTAPQSRPETPSEPPSLSFENVKAFVLEWSAVSGAEYYQLLENPDDQSGYEVVADHLEGTRHAHVVPLYKRVNASYLIRACNAAGCSGDSAPVYVEGNLAGSVGYFKAHLPREDARFGQAVALSADGDTLAVGAYGEDNRAHGINPTSTAGLGYDPYAGAVYVFVRQADTWVQQAYVKASTADNHEWFGRSVALSADGDVLAVGAPGNGSDATGVGGHQDGVEANWSGATYVFKRDADEWRQDAFIKASNTRTNHYFGYDLDLSGDGTTLAVGAFREDSAATGIDGNQADDSAERAGAVYVYVDDADSGWGQQAYIKASNTSSGNVFGYALSLSAAGDTLAVGAHLERGSDSGVDADQTQDGSSSGAVYLFSREGTLWSQDTYLKASNRRNAARFGVAVDLSADGETLAVGASGDNNTATGLHATEGEETYRSAGAAYVFQREADGWREVVYIKPESNWYENEFGEAVALSGNGDTLAIGSQHDGAGPGISTVADQGLEDASGRVSLYRRVDGQWREGLYLQSPQPTRYGHFGSSLAYSADGETLAVGDSWEFGAAAGVGSDATDLDTELSGSGAVFLY